MVKIAYIAVVVCALMLQQAPAHAGIPYKIVTANTTGTYYAIGNDLAKMVAPGGLEISRVPPSSSGVCCTRWSK